MIPPSILFINEISDIDKATQPLYFPDLNLDQVVDTITTRKNDYNLKPFFYTPIADLDLITYRQEVFGDLSDQKLLSGLKMFAESMIQVRRYLGLVEKLDYHYHKEGWYLEATLKYCQSVINLEKTLSQVNLTSRGFLSIHNYIQEYVNSIEFQSLYKEARAVKDDLVKIRYCILLQNGTVQVSHYSGEVDYGEEILKTFEKFKQGAVKDYRVELRESSGMNHVEAKILEFVARLNPLVFKELDNFCERYPQFIDSIIQRFDREVQFYISYLDFIADIQQRGYPFCFPKLTTDKEVFAEETFDLALAYHLLYQDNPLICNDFSLHGNERIIVVTGPNQGGKTTFARMFGQLHHLAKLGCPIPGRAAQLYLFDQIFTHFEREEKLRTLRGKLQDDLLRIHTILKQATPQSIFILNEIFSSTTLKDAIFLSERILSRISELDSLCVWVTFLDELSTFNEKVISMVSTVQPDNPLERTFKIIRKPADGLAYALSLAEKHRLSYKHILERIHP